MKLGTVRDTDQLQLWKFLREIYLRIISSGLENVH